MCPDDSDLLIRLEIRASESPDLLRTVMSLCPVCEDRTNHAVRTEQARGGRQAVRRDEHMKQIGAATGVLLFILMCLLLWGFFR